MVFTRKNTLQSRDTRFRAVLSQMYEVKKNCSLENDKYHEQNENKLRLETVFVVLWHLDRVCC